jgi:hypothetical protein
VDEIKIFTYFRDDPSSFSAHNVVRKRKILIYVSIFLTSFIGVHKSLAKNIFRNKSKIVLHAFIISVLKAPPKKITKKMRYLSLFIIIVVYVRKISIKKFPNWENTRKQSF